jgi:hypothetical protein
MFTTGHPARCLAGTLQKEAFLTATVSEPQDQDRGSRDTPRHMLDTHRSPAGADEALLKSDALQSAIFNSANIAKPLACRDFLAAMAARLAHP